MNRIPCAVLGSTGLVGQQFIRLLSGHPDFVPMALGASAQSAGRSYRETVQWALGPEPPREIAELTVQDWSPSQLREAGVRVVFSALPATAARHMERELQQEGLHVFSNASAHRLAPDVPIVVPEVNPAHLEEAARHLPPGKGLLACGPNCSTSGLVLALAALSPLQPEEVEVTTFQAVSGAGRHGLFAMNIQGNLVPYIGGEEEKMAIETLKILGSWSSVTAAVAGNLEVHASCARVPVLNGHLESVRVDFQEPVSVESAVECFSSFRGLPQKLELPTAPQTPLIVQHACDRPQPALDLLAGSPERAQGMSVSIGRIRAKGRSLRFFLLVHNTIRGAAGGCLLAAELAGSRDLLQTSQGGRR